MSDRRFNNMDRTGAEAGAVRSAPAPFPDADELADRLRVLADPTRIRLIVLLEQRGRSTVSALTSCLPITQQSVSHQLGVLHAAGIVSRRREGAWVHYELCDWTGPRILRQIGENPHAG